MPGGIARLIVSRPSRERLVAHYVALYVGLVGQFLFAYLSIGITIRDFGG